MVGMKCALVALCSALVLSLAVGLASANHISISNQTFRMVWSPLTWAGTEVSVRCPVTLEGSFTSRTLTKTVGAQVARITRADVGTCTGGTETFLTETLPWTLQYESFSGTLPLISRVTLGLIGFDHLLVTGFMNTERCQYRYEQTEPGAIIANLSGGSIESVRIDESRRHVLTRETLTLAPCDPRLGNVGTGSMTTPGGTRLTVSLI